MAVFAFYIGVFALIFTAGAIIAEIISKIIEFGLMCIPMILRPYFSLMSLKLKSQFTTKSFVCNNYI